MQFNKGTAKKVRIPVVGGGKGGEDSSDDDFPSIDVLLARFSLTSPRPPPPPPTPSARATARPPKPTPTPSKTPRKAAPTASTSTSEATARARPPPPHNNPQPTPSARAAPPPTPSSSRLSRPSPSPIPSSPPPPTRSLAEELFPTPPRLKVQSRAPSPTLTHISDSEPEHFLPSPVPPRRVAQHGKEGEKKGRAKGKPRPSFLIEDSEDERIAARSASVQPIFKLTNPAPSSTSTTPKPPPPTTSKPPPTPSSKARAARRVTITLSSDSEDSSDADSPLFPPSTPRAGPSLHQHQHKHVEAISICGNSDDEDEDGSDGNDTVALDPRDDFADDGFGFEFEDSGVLVYNPPRSSKPTRLAPSVVVSSAPTPTPTRAPLASMSNTIDLTNSDSDDDGGPTPNGLSSGPSGSGPGLPDGIEIRWNNRLLNTAGRAIWKKVRNGPETKHQLAIELSTKVTDTADKLLHTLAHELCHIAAWILSGEMKPDHGPAFKLWAKRVTIMRPEIHITTTHSYKIAYKFSWRCDRTVCGKTFGRHSNSINPKTQGCPCGGRLSPIDSLGNVKTPAKKSAYQLYVSEMTPVLRRENPGTTQAQIFKMCAEKWRAAGKGRDLMGALEEGMEGMGM